MIVEKEVDHVKPAELAAWIVEGRTDYRLLDLRSEAEFAAYHVPTAENVPVSALPDFPLLPREKVVLYSEGGIHAAQAWFLLRAQGHTAVYTVLGGLDGWKDEVLFPEMPADASPQELARFERTAAVARFFGGTPRTASDAAAATDGGPQMPALATPASSRVAQVGVARAGPRVTGLDADEEEKGRLLRLPASGDDLQHAHHALVFVLENVAVIHALAGLALHDLEDRPSRMAGDIDGVAPGKIRLGRSLRRRACGSRPGTACRAGGTGDPCSSGSRSSTARPH